MSSFLIARPHAHTLPNEHVSRSGTKRKGDRKRGRDVGIKRGEERRERE